MNKYGLVFVIFFLIFFGLPLTSYGLLSQSINPDESWLTIYQDIDRAWVVEKVTLSLHQGENRFFLTGDNLLSERFYFHPFDSLTSLKTIGTTAENGYQVKIEAQQTGSYSFLLSFFISGFNWKERYVAIWDENDSLFYLYPSVFLTNRKNMTWKNVHISWLLGKPTFLFEGDKGGAPEAEELALEKRAQPQIMMDSGQPVTMERVSEYQIFHLPYTISLPGNSILQVFPELRRFPVKEIVRIENGNETRILKMKSEGDPLPQGWVTIFTENQKVVGTYEFPRVRTQEEFEIPIGSGKAFQADRVEVSYKRMKVDFNKERDVVGFWSEKVIRFDLFNRDESSRPVEIIELLPPGAKLAEDQDWKWEDGKALLELAIEPNSEKKVFLRYEFREDWS